MRAQSATSRSLNSCAPSEPCASPFAESLVCRPQFPAHDLCPRQRSSWEAVGFPLTAGWVEGASDAIRSENADGTIACALSKLFFFAKAILQKSMPPRNRRAAACTIPRSTVDAAPGAKVWQLPPTSLRSAPKQATQAAGRSGRTYVFFLGMPGT